MSSLDRLFADCLIHTCRPSFSEMATPLAEGKASGQSILSGISGMGEIIFTQAPMFKFMTRKLALTLLLGLAMGVPYLLHTGKLELASWGGGDSNQGSGTPNTSIGNLLTIAGETREGAAADGSDGAHPGALLSGPEVGDLETVFRFSATPEWIMQHWSRVSVLEIDSMRGFRVPVVSGMQLDDVAGSLTYCFDDNNRLQRISFRGATGDPRRLEQLVSSSFGLKPQASPGAGLYLARWNGLPTSFLKIENTGVVRADSPYSRYAVRMEINRPRSHLKVGQELQQIAQGLKRDSTWRW